LLTAMLARNKTGNAIPVHGSQRAAGRLIAVDVGCRTLVLVDISNSSRMADALTLAGRGPPTRRPADWIGWPSRRFVVVP
jgi:hypothetical protein